MQLICKNPYRILGLSITASDREIAKRVSSLSVYAEMGKSVNYDYDFADFAPLERSIETILDAERKLEQPKDKLLHSLFWISYDNDDNPLKDLKTDSLVETFNRIPNNSIFNLHNKAIITLFSNNDVHTIQKGINLFNKFIFHNIFNDFEKKITGQNSSLNYDISGMFFDELLTEVMKNFEPKEVFNLFKNTAIEEHIKSILIKPIIHEIDSEIEIAKKNTDLEPEHAFLIGEKLFNNTSGNLNELTFILSETDIMVTSISNKLAEQILDCSIAYYNKRINSSFKREKYILNCAYGLIIKAEKLARGGMILNRIIDNIKIFKRIKLRDCFEAVNFFKMIINAYEQLQMDNKNLTIYEMKILNEDMIIKELKNVVTNEIVEKTATSENDELISDFYYQINEVIKRIEKTKEFAKIKSYFIKLLPDSNEIKRDYSLNLLKKKIIKTTSRLQKVRDKTFYSAEINVLKKELENINRWKLFRTKKTKENQIESKTKEINELRSKSEQTKRKEVERIEKDLIRLKTKLKNV